MQKLDKKQVPQFAALCVLSAGVFGYFVVKIVTPSPAAAGTRPRPAPAVAQAAPALSPAAAKALSPAAAKAGATATAAAPADDAPAPTPGMRDPFVVGAVDSGAATQATAGSAVPAAKIAAAPRPAAFLKPAKAAPQVASIREVSPAPVGAPALPFGLRSLPPVGGGPEKMSAAPAKAAAPRQAPPPPAPAWTVTGVLQSAGGQVAVLRNGEARRIVRNGDAVDGVFRVVAVTRSAVVLRHGKTFYHLALGGGGSAAPAPALRAALRAAQAPVQAPALPVAAQAQDGPPAGPAQVLQAALILAHSYMTPAQAQVDACLAAFQARRALPPDVAMRFLDGSDAAPSRESAQALTLDLSRDLYGDGQPEGGGARWQCALASSDPDAAHGAVKITDFTL